MKRWLLLFLLPCLCSCTLLGLSKPISYSEPITGMKFVFVEGGSYAMGDTTGEASDATPVHQVMLPGFHVGIHEVTFDQYDRFCDATGKEKIDDLELGRGNRPITHVSWNDANAMAAWLSEETGLPISLPSEAQWEYFARAGSTKKYWTGDKIAPNKALCADCGTKWDGRHAIEVGSFSPNPWGIYDTLGNVAEWTLDGYHENYEGAPSDGSAWYAEKSDQKMYRGGAFSYFATDLRSFVRDWASTDKKLKDLGFRLVINLPMPKITETSR